MRLANDRFHKGDVHKRFTLECTGQTFVAPYTRYSYETTGAKGKIFDVDVRDSDGAKTYHVNCGFETEPAPIHKKIEDHFGI